MNFYKDKHVLVTGGTGLIGIPLVKKLVNLGAFVHIVAADDYDRFEYLQKQIPEFSFHKGDPCKVSYEYGDLEDYDVCDKATIGKDYVFQLAGSKGAGTIGTTKAATFLTSHLLINLNMLKAAKANNVKKYLLTSTVGVYPSNSSYSEDFDIFEKKPAEGDKYSAWAKRMSELAADAFMREYSWKDIVIVRPGSVYGLYDNFDKDTAMVVGSLINKFVSSKDDLVIVKSPLVQRDFTFADDVAEGMVCALEKGNNCNVFNLSSGEHYTIKDLAENIQESLSYHGIYKTIAYENMEVKNERVLNIKKAEKDLGFKCATSLYDGIRNTIEWYLENKDIKDLRYNVFKEDHI